MILVEETQQDAADFYAGAEDLDPSVLAMMCLVRIDDEFKAMTDDVRRIRGDEAYLFHDLMGQGLLDLPNIRPTVAEGEELPDHLHVAVSLDDLNYYHGLSEAGVAAEMTFAIDDLIYGKSEDDFYNARKKIVTIVHNIEERLGNMQTKRRDVMLVPMASTNLAQDDRLITPQANAMLALGHAAFSEVSPTEYEREKHIELCEKHSNALHEQANLTLKQYEQQGYGPGPLDEQHLQDIFTQPYALTAANIANAYLIIEQEERDRLLPLALKVLRDNSLAISRIARLSRDQFRMIPRYPLGDRTGKPQIRAAIN